MFSICEHNKGNIDKNQAKYSENFKIPAHKPIGIKFTVGRDTEGCVLYISNLVRESYKGD